MYVPDFVKASICDFGLVKELLAKNSINTIVHFAAESHVDRSIEGPDQFIETNILGTHTLLKAAREVWMDHCDLQDHLFHHVSTDEVYGSLEASEAAFTEKTPYAPNSPYAASKAAADQLVRAYHKTYGLNVTTSNCSNNYGPYQFPEKLIPHIILNAVQGKPLPVYGKGNQIRDWLYVEDHARALVLAAKEAKNGATFNIGGWNEKQNIAVVETICGILED